MSVNKLPLKCLACSVFKEQIELLCSKGKLDIPVQYINSMLHMRPKELDLTISKLIAELEPAIEDILLIFGECHNCMDKYDNKNNVHRLDGFNCVEILLGTEQYRSLIKQGVFFLLPEWAVRWREVFKQELDLSGENARDFMREMHTKLLYLDTGNIDVPRELLNEISEALGLPWELYPVNGDMLLRAIKDKIGGLAHE